MVRRRRETKAEQTLKRKDAEKADGSKNNRTKDICGYGPAPFKRPCRCNARFRTCIIEHLHDYETDDDDDADAPPRRRDVDKRRIMKVGVPSDML